MKTYLIEKFKSLKSKIEFLDQKAEIQKIEDEVKNILCKNPWHVFNDGDQNELYLFDKNNTLSIVYAGKVTKAEWKYVKDLKSVEITTKDQIYMLQMVWLEDSELLCMRLYGTNEYCFMIEDQKRNTCGFKQLSDVTNYILAIEKQRIEAAKRAEEQWQELERQRIEEEKARRERERIEDAKKRLLMEREKWKEEAENLTEVQLLSSKEKVLIKKAMIFFGIASIVFILILISFLFFVDNENLIGQALLSFIYSIIAWFVLIAWFVFYDAKNDLGNFFYIAIITAIGSVAVMVIIDILVSEEANYLSIVFGTINLLFLVVSICYAYYLFIICDKNKNERIRIITEYVENKESEWRLQENVDF